MALLYAASSRKVESEDKAGSSNVCNLNNWTIINQYASQNVTDRLKNEETKCFLPSNNITVWSIITVTKVGLHCHQYAIFVIPEVYRELAILPHICIKLFSIESRILKTTILESHIAFN